MATLNISGRKVTVDDSFLQLPPDQQNAAVEEISASLPKQMGNAFTDIVPEIKAAATENIDVMKKAVTDRSSKGAIEGLMDTGKGLLAIPGLIASPITGAARSLIGHPLADLTHQAGKIINPEVAAKDDPAKMYADAKGGVDTAMMALGPNRGVKPLAPPSAAELKTAATNVYQSPGIKSIQIPPQDVGNLAAGIESNLTNAGFRATPGSAPGTLSEIKRMTPTQGVASVGVDDLRAARRALNMTAKQLDQTFKPTPDAAAATTAIREIDTFLDNLAPSLKDANKNYRASKSSDLLDYRIGQAKHRAAKSGSGMNIENTFRQEVDKIPNRGLSAEQRALRDKIVEGTPTRNALRTAGKLGVDGGLSMMIHAGAGLGSGGATLPITAAGTVARKIGELLTRSQMKSLSNSIRSDAPLSKMLATLPRKPNVSKGAKAIAAALMGQNAPRSLPFPQSMLPSYADENQR